MKSPKIMISRLFIFIMLCVGRIIGKLYLLVERLRRPTIQSRNIAPTTAVMRLPIMLEVVMPIRPKSQPPNTPPIIPTTRFTISPKPPPRISLPATAPATIPIIIYQMKLIVLNFIVYDRCSL